MCSCWPYGNLCICSSRRTVWSFHGWFFFLSLRMIRSPSYPLPAFLALAAESLNQIVKMLRSFWEILRSNEIKNVETLCFIKLKNKTPNTTSLNYWVAITLGSDNVYCIWCQSALLPAACFFWQMYFKNDVVWNQYLLAKISSSLLTVYSCKECSGRRVSIVVVVSFSVPPPWFCNVF